MTIQHAALPAEVARFAAQQGLTAHLHTALRLIATNFPEAVALRADVVHDPDGPGSWVSIVVSVLGSWQAARAGEAAFLAEWYQQAPEHAADRIITTLEYC